MTETELDILECFDNNIGNNLDLTKNYIYVLKLVEDRYYVGRTINIFRRIQEHFTDGGSIYTKKYKPLKVVEVEEETTTDDERKMTFKYVEKYGWGSVRGSYWCSLEIPKPNIKRNNKPKLKKFKKLIREEYFNRIWVGRFSDLWLIKQYETVISSCHIFILCDALLNMVSETMRP